jgi:hypothetical protein
VKRTNRVILAMVVASTAITGCARVAPAIQPTYATNSYPLCSSFPDYGNAPCVLLERNQYGDAYEWVAVSTAGELVHVDFPECEEEDGPAPCVWDTLHRGNGMASPGVGQFVIVRD